MKGEAEGANVIGECVDDQREPGAPSSNARPTTAASHEAGGLESRLAGVEEQLRRSKRNSGWRSSWVGSARSNGTSDRRNHHAPRPPGGAGLYEPESRSVPPHFQELFHPARSRADRAGHGLREQTGPISTPRAGSSGRTARPGSSCCGVTWSMTAMAAGARRGDHPGCDRAGTDQAAEGSVAQRRQTFLLSLNDRLRDLDDPNTIMEATVKSLGQFLEVDFVGYGEVDEELGINVISREWSRWVVSNEGRQFPLKDFLPNMVEELKSGRPLAVDDVETDPRMSEPAAQGDLQDDQRQKRARRAAAQKPTLGRAALSQHRQPA